jgi:hypothetical protein
MFTAFGMVVLLTFGVPIVVSVLIVLIGVYLSRKPKESELNLDFWVSLPMHPYDDCSPQRKEWLNENGEFIGYLPD